MRSLSTPGSAATLTGPIYQDPATWIEPLASLLLTPGSALREEISIALTTALMPVAVRELETIPMKIVLEALSQALTHDPVCAPALAAAQVLGAKAAPLAPQLRRLIVHPNPSMRYLAVAALISTTEDCAEQVMPVLLEALATEADEELLCGVCGSLIKLGVLASEAAPLLRQRLATAGEESLAAVRRALNAVTA